MSTPTQSIQTTKLQQAAIPKTVKGWLGSDYFRQQVALVLPKHMTAERFVRVALSALGRVPKLALCTPESVLKCMMTCSELGLEPDGRRAHLIPYKDQCTLIVDYKGLVELAMRSGSVSSIFAQTVCDRDDFRYLTGEITHGINFREPRGRMYAVYCIVAFKDGGKHTEVMTLEDVIRIRGRSKAQNNGPWVTDFDEMAKKTVFRRASKWITLSPEVQDALDRDDAPVVTGTLVAEVPAGLLEAPAEPPVGDPAPIDIAPAQTVQGEPGEALASAEPAAAPDAPLTNGVHTVQEALAEVVTGAGFTYDQFSYWAMDSGNIPDCNSLPSFNEVPTDICKRLLRAQEGLLKSLQRVKGAEGVAP
jgi:recombination protein RecT